jgi:hypothetical protein
MRGMVLIIALVASLGIGCGTAGSGKTAAGDSEKTWREAGPDGKDRIHVRMVDEMLGEVEYVYTWKAETEQLELVQKSELSRQF